MTQAPVAPEQDRRSFRRRQGRRFALLVTLPGLIVGGASVGAAFSTGLLTKKPAASCAPTVVLAPERDSFKVRVQNSNETAGQGALVAKALTKRGFVIQDVGNAPDGVYVKRAAIVYHGAESLDQALLVADQIPGSRVWNDGRPGTTVELVIGYGFTGVEPAAPPPAPLPAEIAVNIYNTTWRPGLASEVADELGARGFRTGEVGNDPAGSFLPDDDAVLRSGPDGADAAAVLAQQLPEVRLQQDDRVGTGVDLVLGNGFHGLLSRAEIPAPPPRVSPPPDTVARPCS